MGIISYRQAFSNMTATVEFHIGKKLRNFDLKTEQFDDPVESVVSVQADCDELDFVLSNVSGILRCKARVQTWYGDDAKFIVKNLLLREAV